MSLPHVLLGLLARGPASGWDLRQRLARDGAVGWDAELPQIYPAMKRLLRGGFVAMKRRRSTKGPARREYRLTAAGRPVVTTRKDAIRWRAGCPGAERPNCSSPARGVWFSPAASVIE